MLVNRVRLVLAISAILALITLPPVLRAQSVQTAVAGDVSPAAPRDFSDDIPAHLSFVEGQVTLERDSKLEPAEANLPLLAGDRLRTRAGGRVEILFADGSTLAVDQNTDLDLLSDSLVRLIGGTLRVTIPRTTEALDYRIDAPGGSVEIRAAGEYRIDTGVDQHGDADVDLTVVRGSAELVNDHGRTLVRAGQHAVATAAEEPSLPGAVNSAEWDEFDRWAEARRADHLVTNSAAYLPDEARSYSGVLDDYGTWGYDANYGSAVWYPRVADDWRPYSRGRWSYTGYYGWMWVGIDTWSWPTHHYGRWGYAANRWFWTPGLNWSPAWVAWGAAPGYVSWCPLGRDGRPVVGFSTYGPSYGPSIGIPGRFPDPFSAWTVLPSSRFNHNVWVSEHMVARNGIPPAIRAEFVERPIAPLPAGPAVPRRAMAPLHAPTMPKDVAAPRPRTADGPFDAARSGGARRSTPPVVTASPAPKSDLVRSAPAQAVDDRKGAGGRTIPDQPDPPARVNRPMPDVVTAPPGKTLIDRSGNDRSGIDQSRNAPVRAIPRPTEPPPPPAAAAEPRVFGKLPEPARQDRTPPPPPATDPPGGKSRAVERVPPPAAPPPPPPASRGRGSEPPPPPPPAAKSAPPPSSAPPPAQAGAAGSSTTSSGKLPPGRGRGGGGA